ncbi:unnamed protein product (macronuclear) [Paramecium tetraurelia]|uniref:Uncharacterized protein n=1 Tax=Paramecium tetraurelia TaxID=5888 RepID=A0CKT2_PARTE|nr:uncharacterized protein GSPATT00007945001 [Paramecium tetraurelia]CAK71399.1 unnamed protein product [Paramecium tetraurelia]|eukprot:XP_001438796.1 hypothetical protein (macronuclear) [Paramecium tetraurelia strain d4-2]
MPIVMKLLTIKKNCHSLMQGIWQYQKQQLILQALSNMPISFQQKEKSLQMENAKLKNENTDLQSQLNKLENKHQELINEIQDLKQLVKRVYQEGEIQISYQKQKNQQLEYKNESLTKALVNLQNNLETFAQLKNLSGFLEDSEISEQSAIENGSIQQ